jgi:peptidoglycan hydrolase-like protein with peptidoglycan-binding domain
MPGFEYIRIHCPHKNIFVFCYNSPMHSISTKLGSALLVSIFLFFLVSITFSHQQLTRTYNSILSIAAHTQLAAISGSGSGLVAHYTFDEGSGATAGDSAGSNTGTLVNGPTWVAGRIGGGIQFDGVDDSVTAGSPVVLSPSTGDFSISMWLKLSELPAFGDTLIDDSQTASSDDFKIYTSTSNRFAGQFRDGATTVSANDAVDALVSTVNKWKHYVLLRSGTSVFFYRDGVLINSSSNAGLVDIDTDGSFNFTIGSAVTGGSSSIPGTIDDVRVYNRALSATEITQLSSLGGDTPLPPVTCTSFTYSEWGTCTSGTQTRTVTGSAPAVCTGGTPEQLTQSCSIIEDNSTNCTPMAGGSCIKADANQTAIALAINTARAGDTIRISPGTAVFSSTITINKPLYIIGAGIDTTIINDNATTNGVFILSANGLVRLSGFTLTGGSSGWNGSLNISQNNARLDHIRFNQINGRHPIIGSGNLSNVVIDHSVFESGGLGINILGNRSYWTDPSQYAPGTGYGIYLEDNTFNAGGVEVVDLNYGGAYVVRYSTINNGGNLAVHGADSGDRAGGYIEVYNNTFSFLDNSGSKRDMSVIMRGGSALIFSNVITGAYNSTFKLQNWRSTFGVNGFLSPFHTDNKNRCQHNSVNLLDSDVSPEDTGWPCKDQIGRGPNQMSTPSYEWNNVWNQGVAQFTVNNNLGGTNPSTYDHVKNDRDYFNNTCKPGYTPYTYPHPLVQQQDGVPAQSITLNCPGVTPTQPSTYTITATKSGTGQGTVTGTGLSCVANTCTANVANSSSITLTATPTTGSTFTGWSNGCTGTSTCTLSSAASVTATFTLVPDTTLPTISLTSPSGTISGPVTLSATASDNVGVTSVQFLIDGSLISTLTTAPYTGSWNTTGISDGTHTLTAIARDAAGNTRTSNPVTVTVNNNTAPVLASIGSKSVTTGTPLTFTILATDAQNNPLTYSISSLPSGASFSNRVFTWTPSSVGTYTTRFTVSDGTLTDFEDVTITVTAPLPVSEDSDGDGVANATDKCPLTPLSLRSEVNIYGCPKPKTTKFTIVPNPATTDISTSLSSLEISNAYGKVTYSTPVVLYRDQTTYKGQLDIDTNMNISGSTISLTSSSLPELNKTATISLYNIGYANPRILKDGVVCTTCTFVSYTNGTYTFRVTGFSTYTVEETPPTTTGGGTSSSGGSSTGTFTPTVTQVAVGGGSISTSTPATSPYAGLSLLLRNLYRGITGEDVRTLQRFLTIEGLLTIDIPTTYFGILTETAVKAFQAKNNIVSSGDPYSTGYGSVGPKTRSVINAKIGNTTVTPVITSTYSTPITQTLIYDMTDPQVSTLQSYLISKGYLTSQPTGYFGTLTEAAVKKLQCEKLAICSGTAETTGWGVVGQRTRSLLVY